VYVPRHFAQDDDAELARAVAAYPLATLVTAGADDGALDASPLPMLLSRDASGAWLLRGHLARANPHGARLDGRPALAAFSGPSAYVSPSLYPSKAEHGRVVPTWNYVAVHAHGIARLVTEPGWLRQLVDQLTATHEAGRPAPWALADAPAGYVDGLLGAIVGVELTGVRLVGKWKLSQNRPDADRAGVAAGLTAAGGPAATVAAEMLRLRRP
jgi:transcriptional regulator